MGVNAARHSPREPPSQCGMRPRSRSGRYAGAAQDLDADACSSPPSRNSARGFGGHRGGGGGGGSVFWQAPTTGAPDGVRDRRGRLYPPTEEEREAEEGALRPPVIEVVDAEADWRRAEERSWLHTDLDSLPSASFPSSSVGASALADDPWPLADAWTEIDDSEAGFGDGGWPRPSAVDSSRSLRTPRGGRRGGPRRPISRTTSARLSTDTTLSRGPSFAATRPTALSFPLDARTAKAWVAAAASGVGHWRPSVCA